MRPLVAIAMLALAGLPAAAQQAGGLPPPVLRPAEPAPAQNDADPARTPGPAERAGAAIDRAAENTGQALERAAEGTGSAVGRAMRWTGERLQGAGEWTQRQGERLTGPEAPPAGGTPARP